VMASLPVAQALTTQWFGPRRVCSMAMRPAAMLLIIIGTKKGEMRRAPFSSRFSTSSTKMLLPPTPVPITTPIRSRASSDRASGSRPASSRACWVTASAYWLKRSWCRICLSSR